MTTKSESIDKLLNYLEENGFEFAEMPKIIISREFGMPRNIKLKLQVPEFIKASNDHMNELLKKQRSRK